MATPKERRLIQTFVEFMVLWKVDEYVLSTFHARPGFVEDVLGCMTPWVRSVTEVREAIRRNAADPTRADQWLWIQRYERMLVSKVGKKGSFLPVEEKKDDGAEPKRSAEPAGRPAAPVAPAEPDEPDEPWVEV